MAVYNYIGALRISHEELLRHGFETSDGYVYVVRLDKNRFLDIHYRHGEWIYFLREEPTAKQKDLDTAIFTGREVELIEQITDLYFLLTGKRMTKKRNK